ncbi:MAG: polyprenyl synthetase family protein [Tepidisphaeraceae bacterium]
MNRSGSSLSAAEMDATGLLERSARLVSDYFVGLDARYPTAPPRLVEAIKYSLMAGGKRLRPALVLECARACGDGEPSASALAAAVAMELIHTFSLVHDDLPAMDDDDLRRGRPTNHKVYGEAMAILAGDAMTTMAFEILASQAEPKLVPALVGELAAASGPAGMIGGQVIDMDQQHPPKILAELQRLHRMKTGALLTASCRMGAIAGGARPEQLAALEAFGRRLGLAFQIVDDILDQTATAEELGKATKKDQAKGKVTYPMLIGLEASRREAREQLAAAMDVLQPLGSDADGLRALAEFVVNRNR